VKVLAAKKFSNDVCGPDIATYALTTPIQEIVADLDISEACYLYASENEVVAAIVATDATPADEWIFIGRYDPRVSV